MHAMVSLFLLLTVSQPQSGEELLAKVSDRYSAISTIKGNFSQQTCIKASGLCQEFSGKFYIKRLNLFRLEVTSPESQLIVSDGTILWTYLKKDKKAYKADVTKSQTVFSPFELLLNYQARYSIQLLPADDGQFVVRLLLKVQSPLIGEIRLMVSADDYTIKKFTVLDTMGNEMVFTLSRVKYNQKLSSGFFSFTPPVGVEIITTTPGFQEN